MSALIELKTCFTPISTGLFKFWLDVLKIFSVHLEGTFLRHQPYFWLNVHLMPFVIFCGFSVPY